MTQTTKRVMKNPAAWVGKRINPQHWIIPQGYELCAYTGKFHAESDLEVTFAHWKFERKFLIKHGMYIEDAAWLSEEGFDLLMGKLDALGLRLDYINFEQGQPLLGKAQKAKRRTAKRSAAPKTPQVDEFASLQISAVELRKNDVILEQMGSGWLHASIETHVVRAIERTSLGRIALTIRYASGVEQSLEIAPHKMLAVRRRIRPARGVAAKTLLAFNEAETIALRARLRPDYIPSPSQRGRRSLFAEPLDRQPALSTPDDQLPEWLRESVMGDDSTALVDSNPDIYIPDSELPEWLWLTPQIHPVESGSIEETLQAKPENSHV